jgi:hypothetical protein
VNVVLLSLALLLFLGIPFKWTSGGPELDVKYSAASEEREQKLKAEVLDEVIAQGGEPSEVLMGAKQFELLARDALRADLFPVVLDEVVVKRGIYSRMLDAVAYAPHVDFVIEFKYSARGKDFDNWVQSLDETVRAYEETFRRPARGLLVLPRTVNYQENTVGSRIGVLKFDEKAKMFVNSNEIRNWIDNQDRAPWG